MGPDPDVPSDIREPDLGRVGLDRPDEEPTTPVANHLGATHPPVAERQAAEAGKAENRYKLAQIQVTAPVRLAPEGENGVGPAHGTVDTPGQVDAEEREARVGDRVDQGPAEVSGLRPEDA